MPDMRPVFTMIAAVLMPAGAHASADLARNKNCVACHALERRSLGPSFKTIAARYANDDGARKALSEKVRAGGAGVWGQTAMPPQPQVSPEDAAALVGWILSLE